MTKEPMWRDRIEAATAAYAEWSDLPIDLLMDKILKAAGVRDLVKDRADLAVALDMIESNEHGESWSAGVAMSALASIREAREETRC